ncbi:MAG: chemotaxis protein CheW [Xanthomonadales bacterium]|nr:chemotaxis protein CheW [Xanthomonadales bacterium]
MNGKPTLDDYFDALLGEPSAAAEPVVGPSAAAAGPEQPASPPPQPPAQTDAPQAAAAPAAAAAAAAAVVSAPLGAPLDELEAVFEQAHAEAKAAGVFNQAPSTPAPAAPLGDPLDELEAVFEQAHAAAKASGVFNQAPTTAAPAAPLGDPLDELEAVFEQAHADAKKAGVFQQTPAAPPKSAGNSELDELEAAFEAAAEAARSARQAAVAAAPPLPSRAPLPGPAEVPPQHGVLKPQLAKRSEAMRRRLARRRQVEVSEDAPIAVEKFHRWLRFQMGGQSYAVELLKVQEVQRVPDILPVRGASSHVMGVMNLRGQIIAVIDLGACIGLPHEPLTEASRVIVLETEEETVGLLVSAVAEVISLSERAVENPVSSIPALPREALIGIARHGSHMSVLLDATVFLR